MSIVPSYNTHSLEPWTIFAEEGPGEKEWEEENKIENVIKETKNLAGSIEVNKGQTDQEIQKILSFFKDKENRNRLVYQIAEIASSSHAAVASKGEDLIHALEGLKNALHLRGMFDDENAEIQDTLNKISECRTDPTLLASYLPCGFEKKLFDDLIDLIFQKCLEKKIYHVKRISKEINVRLQRKIPMLMQRRDLSSWRKHHIYSDEIVAAIIKDINSGKYSFGNFELYPPGNCTSILSNSVKDIRRVFTRYLHSLTHFNLAEFLNGIIKVEDKKDLFEFIKLIPKQTLLNELNRLQPSCFELGCAHLREFNFYFKDILGDMKHFSSIGLEGSRKDFVQILRMLTNVESIATHLLDCEDLKELKNLKQLKSLELVGDNITEKWLSQLKDLPNLEELSIRSYVFSDKDFKYEYFSEMPNLKELILIDCDIKQISTLHEFYKNFKSKKYSLQIKINRKETIKLKHFLKENNSLFGASCNFKFPKKEDCIFDSKEVLNAIRILVR